MMALFNVPITPIVGTRKRRCSSFFASADDNQPLSSTPFPVSKRKKNPSDISCSRVSSTSDSSQVGAGGTNKNQKSVSDKTVERKTVSSVKPRAKNVIPVKKIRRASGGNITKKPEMCKKGQSEKNKMSKIPLKVDKTKKSTTRKRNESSPEKGERSASLQEEVDPYSISNEEDDDDEEKEKENMKLMKNKKKKKTSNLTAIVSPDGSKANQDIVTDSLDGSRTARRVANLSTIVEVQKKQTIHAKQKEIKRAQRQTQKSPKKTSKMSSKVPECKISQKMYDRWKPVAEQSVEFVMEVLDRNLNKSLVKCSQADSKEMVIQFSILKERTRSRISELRAPTSVVNYRTLAAQMNELKEEAADQDEILERLDSSIKTIQERIQQKKIEWEELMCEDEAMGGAHV